MKNNTSNTMKNIALAGDLTHPCHRNGTLVAAIEFNIASRKVATILALSASLSLLCDAAHVSAVPAPTINGPNPVASLNVAVISDAVAQAESVRDAAAKDTIALVYHSDRMTLHGLVEMLAAVSAAHHGARIGHLGIVSHGCPGEVVLGHGDALSLAMLPSQAVALAGLRSLLADDSRLDLFSCAVASGALGKTFVDQLAAVTGAAVFASDNPVGSVPGADFVWEYHTGEAPPSSELLSLQDMKSIPGLCLYTYLSASQVAQAAYGAGFSGGPLVNAVAVADAESSFRLDVVSSPNSDGSVDRGLWQINSKAHPTYDLVLLLSNAAYNASAAHDIYTAAGNYWTPWSTFNNGAFMSYLPTARTAASGVDSTVIRAVNDQVTPTATANVRATAGGTITRTINAGATGTVIGGPTVAPIGAGTYRYIWWNIHWSDGLGDGWVVEGYLSRAATDTTPPAVTISSPYIGQTFSTSPITVSGTASDAGGSGLQKVFVDNPTSNSYGTAFISGNSASYTVSGIALVPGLNYILAQAYDNAGNYSTVVATVAVTYNPPDATAPTPNPSTWATAPYATGTSSISMTSTTASDPSGVQYYFHCLTSGGHDSGWQTATTYSDTGLSPGMTYTYQVMAREQSPAQNQGGYSTSSSATTQQAPMAPILFSPGNNTNPEPTVCDTDQTFQWSQAANATSYLLQVKDVTAGTGIKTYPISDGWTTTYPLGGFVPGHAYWWNMYAYAGSIVSPVSATYYFTIAISATVQTSPPGLSITVDGTTYAAPQTFSWTAGSSHTIATISPQSGGTGIQYSWGNWSDGGAVSHAVTPTVGTTYTVNFIVNTALQNWRQTWYGTTDNSDNAADNADPYHIGIPNLLVFAFAGPNQNPALAKASQLPQIRRNGGNLYFSFTPPAGVSGITYGAEWSQTLSTGSWTAVADTGSSPQHVFSVPIGTKTKLFMRLKVTSP